MRKLIYVPVIHTSADLGSIAKHVTNRGIADLGQELWEKHKRTVDGFWNVVSDYFDSMDVSGVKIYQDGMVAADEVGRKIVEDTAKAGSKNYQLILRLLDKGAILVKTEDFALVKKEYDRLQAITHAKSITKKLIAFMKYKLVKTILLSKRDAYIAGRIEQTLKADEKAILFIGAFHNMKKRLLKSIQVKEVKDAVKVRKYQKLLPFCNRYGKQFDELAEYLISEIKDIHGSIRGA
jgi:pheromone shutdown protein TraB